MTSKEFKNESESSTKTSSKEKIPAPFISVVIPTYNFDVSNLVSDLHKTKYTDYEIIVVDDCSTKEIQHPEGVQYIRHGQNKGASYARNTGAYAAKGDIILFIDSDVILREIDNPQKTPVDIIKAHAEAYKDKAIAGVLGLLQWFNKNPVGDIFLQSIIAWPFSWPLFFPVVPWGPTANLSVRKDIFLKINGFDLAYPKKGGCEDTDFGVRLSQYGKIKTILNSVFHPSPRKLKKEVIDRVFRWGRGEFRLLEKFPKNKIWKIPYFFLFCTAVLIFTGIYSYYRNINIFTSLFYVFLSYIIAGSIFAILRFLFTRLLNLKKQKGQKRPFANISFFQFLVSNVLMQIWYLGKMFQAIRRGRIIRIFQQFIVSDTLTGTFKKANIMSLYSALISLLCSIGMCIYIFM